MRASWLTLILLGITIVVPAVAAPPLPEGIEPKPWDPPSEMTKLLRGAYAIEDQGQMTAYLERVEAALEEHPDWVDLHRHYISMSVRTDQFAEIQETYRKLAQENPEDPDLLFLAGQAARSQASVGHYSDALDLQPDHFYSLCAFGLTLASGKGTKQDEGFEHLFEALRTRPNHPFAYQALAIAYSRGSTDYENAIKVCRLWQEVEPDGVTPVQLEASYLGRLDRSAEGLERIEAFAKEHPKDRAGLRALVNAYAGAQRFADAAQTQLKLAGVAKASPLQAYNAAVFLAQSGDKDRSLEWLQKAGERGYHDRQRAESDKVFVAFREDPAFEKALATIDNAYEKKLPELKGHVLATMIRQDAPEFAVTTLSGKDVSLEGLKGKVVVLDFWATWCKPCRQTLPLVQELSGTMKNRPVEILCMNVWERDKDRKQVEPFWTSNSFTMEVGLGSPTDATNYGVTGIPALFIIDQQGQIRYKHRGYSAHMDREIAWVIEELLGESDQGANLGDR